MRFFITAAVPTFEAALIAAGHLVVSTPAHHAALDVAAAVSPLKRLLERSDAEVAVVVNPLRPGWGLPRRALRSWASNRRGLAVALATNDPTVWNIKRPDGCVCRHDDFAVYVTNSAAVAADAAKRRRAVHWTAGDGVAGVLAAIEHARSRQIYSPKRDAGRW